MTVDVAIVGGGPVGACAAALLVRCGGFAADRIALIERAPAERWSAGDAPDLRVWSLSRASERILAAAGAWPLIAASRICPYERMRVWPARASVQGPGALGFDAGEAGEPNLGYVVENRLVQWALAEALEREGVVTHRSGLRGLRFEARQVELETEAGPVNARLVVGADGARSAVRELAGIAATGADYDQLGIVANVSSERSHEHTAWQRFLEPGTLALLPLESGQSSIVWSVPSGEGRRLLALAPDEFSAELTAASEGALGALRLESERLSFPLQRLEAERYVLERCALVGDAAHVVHPLAGQGVNLGLLDAAALVDALARARAEREDPGALRILRAYERWRRGENETMSAALDALNRFLAFGAGPLAGAAQRGMGVVDRSGPLKRFFVDRALGLAGELPGAARSKRN